MRTFILLLSASLIFGCGSKKSEIIFKNDMSMKTWHDAPDFSIVKDKDAPTIPYVCRIDSTSSYSATYSMRVSDISEEPLSSITLSAWVKVSDLRVTPDLVVNIRDSDDNSIEWLNKKLYLSKPNKWIKETFKVNLKESNRNKKDNFIRVYVSCGNSTPAFVDDIEIQFE